MRAAVLALCLIAPPAGAEAFFDIGISHSQIESKNTDVSVRPDRTETSLHLGIGASRSVGERGELMDNNIRLVHSGCPDPLPKYARRALDKTIELTAGNTGSTLNLAINYGGRSDIVRAARQFAADVNQRKLAAEDLDISTFGRYLYHAELGDPDLLIRTSGELRISNFMLWQLAYTEIYVTPTLWPDFGRVDFLEALVEFQKRDRRYGAIG